MPTELRLFAVPGLPEITAGSDLVRLVANAIAGAHLLVTSGDVVIIAQKIVSKAEGAIVRLRDVTPSAVASRWAEAHARDPAVVEVVLREATRIVRMDRGVIIAETHHGFVCANAGVDASNVPNGYVTLLPRNPDASAQRLREGLRAALECDVAVIISDTFGRPWREGFVNVALGVAGLQAVQDYRGQRDRYGRALQTTMIAVADELASAAELVMGKTAQTPVAIARGAAEWAGEGTGTALLRSPAADLFR